MCQYSLKIFRFVVKLSYHNGGTFASDFFILLFISKPKIVLVALRVYKSHKCA